MRRIRQWKRWAFMVLLPEGIVILSLLLALFIASFFLKNTLQNEVHPLALSLLEESAEELSSYYEKRAESLVQLHYYEEAYKADAFRRLTQDEDITLVTYIKGDDVLFFWSEKSSSSHFVPSVESWVKRAREKEGEVVYFPPESDDDISLVLAEGEYILRIDLRNNGISRLSEMNLGFSYAFLLKDSDYRFISETWSGYSVPYTMRLYGGYVKSVPPLPMETWEKKVENTPYTLVLLIDKTSFRQPLRDLWLVMLLLLLLEVLSLGFFSYVVYRRGERETEDVISVMERVRKGDFSARLKKWRLSRYQDVEEAVNATLEEVDLKIQKTLIAELREKEAENKALQSQIQPHFLFNTINNLIALLYDENMEKLEKSLYQLSDLMHYALRKESTVTLGDELDFLDGYMSLQALRFSNRMDYRLMIQEDTRTVQIPRLLLQPFVENAIIHGIEPKKTSSLLIVSSQWEEEDVVIVIRDNGVGFDREKTDLSKRIGFSNSMERLKLLYQGSTTTIVSRIGEGCTVRIQIKGAKDADHHR